MEVRSTKHHEHKWSFVAQVSIYLRGYSDPGTCTKWVSSARGCGEVEEVLSVLTSVVSGVVQDFHELLLELRLLLVAEGGRRGQTRGRLRSRMWRRSSPGVITTAHMDDMEMG